MIRAVLPAFLLLAACSGGGAPSTGGGGGGAPPILAPPGGPSCTLRARQDWAAAQIREWYLFPETLPADLDPGQFTTVSDYVDALTATARGQGRDRFFTFLTSIREEDAFFERGETAAFGIRIETDTSARRLFVIDAYEGAPALAAGLDRGVEILAIGPSEAALRSVDSIIAAEGADGISDAFGPGTPGLARAIEFRTVAGETRRITIAKANFDLLPISPRFGTRVIDTADGPVGYVNLRTFIDPSGPALRTAFDRFRARGINRVIVDFRYNGGGLVSVAELMGDLLGGNRLTSDVFSFTRYRPEKASLDLTRRFRVATQAISPTRIAFITTGTTASASELVINSMTPWLGGDSAIIGADTFGKPVGQIARDREACDDRLRITAFRTENADRRGDYFNGLAREVATTCAATDDRSRAMGDPAEASTARALDFLAGRACQPIATGFVAQSEASARPRRELPVPKRPSVAQREVPGTF